MLTQLSGGGIRSFISKHDLTSGLQDTYNTFRPEQYPQFVSPFNNTKVHYLNNRIVSTGYTEDTLTGNRSYLICFYDTNAT